MRAFLAAVALAIVATGGVAIAQPGEALAATGGVITVSAAPGSWVTYGDDSSETNGMITRWVDMPPWQASTTYTVAVSGSLGNEYVVCGPGGGVWLGPQSGQQNVFASWIGPPLAPTVLDSAQLPATVSVPAGNGSIVCFVAPSLTGSTPEARAYGYDVDQNWAGNVGPFYQFQVAVDPATPGLTFSGASADAWLHSATVNAIGTEPSALSGIGSVACALNGGVSNLRYPATDYSLPVSTNGANTISCTSETVAQVSSAPASETVYVDSQSPTVAFPDMPGSTWLSSPATVNPTAREATNVSGMASEQCAVNGGPERSVSGSSPLLTPGANTGTLSDPLVVAANGSDTISCVATTNAGVSSGTATSAQINIDAQVPSVAYSGPATQTWVDPWLKPYVDDESPVMTVTGSEQTSVSGIANVRCSLNGGVAETDGNGPDNLTAGENDRTVASHPNLFDSVDNGADLLTCTTTTNAGLTSGGATGYAYIDSQTPIFSFLGATGTVEGATATVVAKAAEGSDLSGIASETCSADKGPAQTVYGASPRLVLGANSQAVQQVLTVTGSGDHTISCNAATNAGATWTGGTTITLLTPPGHTPRPTSNPPSQTKPTEAGTAGVAPADPQLKRPEMQGVAKVGAVLTARLLSRTPRGVKLAFQWYMNGKKIRGATRGSLRLVREYAGKRISLDVIATARGHATTSRRSAPSHAIAK